MAQPECVPQNKVGTIIMLADDDDDSDDDSLQH